MPNKDDIWDYAKGRVENKSVLLRIAHSPKLHSFRSAVSSKGSAASKGLGIATAVGRAALSAIPIPAIGDLIASAQTAVEKAVRSHLHSARKSAAKDLETQVKFELKELSLEEMDRFRWKAKEATEAFNTACTGFWPNVNAKKNANAQCEAYLEVAMAGEQASRRLNILRTKCLGVIAAMNETLKWVNELETGSKDGKGKQGVTGKKNEFSQRLKDLIEEEIRAAETEKQLGGDAARDQFILNGHGKCELWCCFRAAGQPDDYKNWKDNAAKVANFLTAPFDSGDVIASISDVIQN